MKPYVMFGVHPLFGDYVDAIHSNGGYLSRVVMNVQEPERPPGERFIDSLERYHNWLKKKGTNHQVEVVRLDQFKFNPDETAVLGFRGTKVLPLVQQLKQEHGISFPPLIHPTATVSQMGEIEKGVFVGAGSVVASHAYIGAFSLINRGATIGHDSVLERCVVVGPSTSTAAFVRLCEGSVLGIGCTVIERLVIGAGSYVAAGAVVLKDVAPDRLVAGVPAVEKKVLKA